MKKALIIGIIVLLAVGAFIAVKQSRTKDTSLVTSPTIQILRAKAYLVDAQGARSKEIKNGSSLTAPLTILVAKGGLVNINFPDGSMARVDGGSTFTIKKSDYNTTTGKSNTSIFLAIGIIWSKVVELATVDSSWEVQTSNAIATVRGTAFNTIVKGKITTFTGSEHTVSITPINPKTHELLKDQEVPVTEHKEVEISSDQLESIASTGRKMVVLDHRPDQAMDAWINQNENQDVTMNEAVSELKQKMKGKLMDGDRIPPDLRDELRSDMQERLHVFYKEHQQELHLENTDVPGSEPVTSDSAQTNSEPTNSNDIHSNKEVPAVKSTINNFIKQKKVVSMDATRISPDQLLASVLEGASVVAHATMEFSDGTTQDITDAELQSVLTNIKEGGMFTAALDQSKFGGKTPTYITIKFTDRATNESQLVKISVVEMAQTLEGGTVTIPTNQ